MERVYGALPPDHLKWQIGKTAASIVFVNEAERELIWGQLDHKDYVVLEKRVEEIRSGQVVLEEFQTVEDFFRSLET